MRRTANRAALGGLAALLVTLATPVTSAHADQGDTLKGGCGMYSEGGSGQNPPQQGIIYESSTSQEASGGPSGATVSCWIDVNGAEQPGTRITAAGTGEQSGAAQISYHASDTDAVNICQQVTFWDGSTWVGRDGTNPDCPAVTEAEFPPPVVGDAVDTVLAEVSALQHNTIDPVMCPILITLSAVTGGGVAGIHIHPDGDVYAPPALGGGPDEQVYDCPPYNGFSLLTISLNFSATVIRWYAPPGA